jgi:plasmid stabilization system protein ParE
MAYQVFYQSEVEKDVADAKKWYKSKQPGLDKRFSSAVKQTIAEIIKNPLRFSKRYKDYRIAYTKVFPFGIHFYLDETQERILVVAILHVKRDLRAILENR